MPSTGPTKTLSVLDLENDRRDWIGEFPIESKPERPTDSLHNSETLFTVVQYGRTLPIVLNEPPAGAEVRPQSGHHHRSLIRRAKHAASPALTALFIAYLAVVLITAWIGVRRGNGTGKGDSTPQMSTPAPETFEPGNRP